MSLKDALEQLKNAVGDLTSLEVQTYVGELDVIVKDQQGSTNFEEMLKKARASNQLSLQLVTKVNFDGDAIALVPSSAPADYVQEAHEAALELGNDVRQGLLMMFADVIGDVSGLKLGK